MMTPKQSADIKRTLSVKCAGLGIPVSGIFELTPRCNLQCKMCYVRMTPEQMSQTGREKSAEELLDIAKDAADAGMMFLLLTGGEPTLREDFSEIYEGLSKLGLSISVNTNGTLLTPAIRELWHRLPPAQVNVTLYGTNREDYEKLCGNPDAFDKVCDGLNWLKSEGILIHLNTTMTTVNLPHWERIESFAKSNGIDLRMTAYCFPPVRRSECESCTEYSQTRLSPEIAGELIARDIFYREGKNGIFRRAANIDTPLYSSCDSDTGDPMQCMAGRSQFWLTWYGGMTPCGMLNNPVANPFNDGFSHAWKKLRQDVDAITLCPDCINCKNRTTCMNCAAVTYAETGRFNGKPEYVCKMNSAYREAILKLAEKIQKTE